MVKDVNKNMKKNYIIPEIYWIEAENEDLICVSTNENEADPNGTIYSKDRGSNYKHEDLGWDY